MTFTYVQACARDHTEPATPLNPDPPPALAAPGATLCHECIERLRFRLTEIPDLAGHIRDMSIPGLQSSLGGGPKVDGTRDWAEPINRAAMDDIDQLWATLAFFAQRAAQTLSKPQRPVRAPYDVGDALVQGVTTAADHHWTKAGAQRVTDWLLSWFDDITATDLAPWMHDDLVPIVTKLRSRYGFRAGVKRAAPRPCQSCGQQEVRVTWDGDRPDVRCAACGWSQPIDWEVVAGVYDMADVPAGR